MNKKENRFCVYLHIRPDKNEVFYTGIGVEKRPYHTIQRSSFWKKIVKNNNGIFEVEILVCDISWDSASQIERSLIKYFGRKDLGTGTLCNMTDGGDGTPGHIVSAEVRKKMSLAALGKTVTMETRQKIREAQLRRPPMSDETRRKIGLSSLGNKHNLGKKASAETIAKLKIANQGNSRAKGFKHTELARYKISKARIGKRQSMATRNKIIKTRVLKAGFYVEQLCKKTLCVIGSYISINEAGRITGLSIPNISVVLSGKRKSTGGFIWRKNYDKVKLNELISHLAA